MITLSKINEYIQALKSSSRMMPQVVHHRTLPAVSSVKTKPDRPWPGPIQDSLTEMGIKDLYSHQVEAINYLRSGKHVVVATPTASGKTLIYNLVVADRALEDNNTTALYIFPLKALAQDQLKTFRHMVAKMEGHSLRADIYDGDTSAYRRKKIRENPPDVLLTNPEMTHLSLLAHHRRWEPFLSRLRMVVVDEVHTYRGIFGSHMSQIIRRLRRICAHYGASPTFLFSSATIGNPSLMAEQLSGLNVHAVTTSGAPQGPRHVVFIDPFEGPAQAAILLLKAALHRNLRTIVYTQSRKLTELIALWAGTQSGKFVDRISAYRAGLLAEERRDIESRLNSGQLLAVVSTSALELGIDIGDLDLCILVGYPGTIVSTLQRGGRVGRSGQEAALILIAGEDALDQYFIRHPDHLFERAPETAVVNPNNADIMDKHFVCAAAELPLRIGEPFIENRPAKERIDQLEKKGSLLKSAGGKQWYSKRKVPHRDIDLRGSGDRFTIVLNESGDIKGEIDGYRVYRETHPGAVYIHKGDTFLVEQVHLDTRTVRITGAHVDYYTKVRGEKDTEILEIYEEKPVQSTVAYMGRLKVTDWVTGYETWAIRGKKKLSETPLSLPPHIFEAEGVWFGIPTDIHQEAEDQGHDFLGGIHALEHAAIGIFPLLVMADRNDLGGLATPYHPQLSGAGVFIYEGIPGGVGITREAYRQSKRLLQCALEAITQCRCESGCPSCVHSPKCGSGNKPIDKASGTFILTRMLDNSGTGANNVGVTEQKRPQPVASRTRSRKIHRLGVFDLETQRSAGEVGGWHRANKMGVSCAVIFDDAENEYAVYREDEVTQLIDHLKRLDRVVGFNIKRFDYHVLEGYSDFDFRKLHTLDILEDVHNFLGFRLSLNHLVQATLGVKKEADGLQALQWWKQGRIAEIIKYCKRDVEITKNLYLFGKEKAYLLFHNKDGNAVRIPVNW